MGLDLRDESVISSPHLLITGIFPPFRAGLYSHPQNLQVERNACRQWPLMCTCHSLLCPEEQYMMCLLSHSPCIPSGPLLHYMPSLWDPSPSPHLSVMVVVPVQCLCSVSTGLCMLQTQQPCACEFAQYRLFGSHSATLTLGRVNEDCICIQIFLIFSFIHPAFFSALIMQWTKHFG